MPIYEYQCTGCHSKFEIRKGFGENSGASCPMCQSQAHRIFSPVPIIFKGPGFYITDSGNNHNDHRDNGAKEKVEAISKESESN